MPALRLDKSIYSYKGSLNTALGLKKMPAAANALDFKSSKTSEEKVIYYPNSKAERSIYRTPEGKMVTSHQWDVYDFVYNIPIGHVTTYKDVCTAVGGSPRSVGSALRNNPFAPYIPCHRVIASNLFVGGFKGEWGPAHKTGTHCSEKLGLLASEGVSFTDTGHLIDAGSVVWRGS